MTNNKQHTREWVRATIEVKILGLFKSVCDIKLTRAFHLDETIDSLTDMIVQARKEGRRQGVIATLKHVVEKQKKFNSCIKEIAEVSYGKG